MALDNYGELKRYILQTLNRGDLDENIPDWIWMAENEAHTELGLPLVEKETTGTFIDDQDFVVMPVDAVEIISFRVDVDPLRFLEVVEPSKFHTAKQNGVGSKPEAMLIQGLNIKIAPTPGTEGYTLWYKGGIDHLGQTATPDDESNWLLTLHVQFLIYAALRHSAPFLRDDERMIIWEGFYQDEKRKLKQSASRLKYGGGPLRMRPETFA